MTSVFYISALEERHQLLKQKIDQELQHLSLDDQKIREMKRKKLELKDEIARIGQEIRH